MWLGACALSKTCRLKRSCRWERLGLHIRVCVCVFVKGWWIGGSNVSMKQVYKSSLSSTEWDGSRRGGFIFYTMVAACKVDLTLDFSFGLKSVNTWLEFYFFGSWLEVCTLGLIRPCWWSSGLSYCMDVLCICAWLLSLDDPNVCHSKIKLNCENRMSKYIELNFQ